MDIIPMQGATTTLAEAAQLPVWSQLSTVDRAFVVAYVENDYSLPKAAKELNWTFIDAKRKLLQPNIKAAVKEVQDSLGEIDYMNEKWVKAHLQRIMPMVMGDEDVPVIDSNGENRYLRIFKPEIALKVIDYVAPKKTSPLVNINQLTVGDDHLQKLANRLVALQKGVDAGEEQ